MFLEEEGHAANVKTVVSRLKPLVQRALDNDGQSLAALGDDEGGTSGAGSETFQKLKNILSKEFADAATVEMEIGTCETLTISKLFSYTTC